MYKSRKRHYGVAPAHFMGLFIFIPSQSLPLKEHLKPKMFLERTGSWIIIGIGYVKSNVAQHIQSNYFAFAYFKRALQMDQ